MYVNNRKGFRCYFHTNIVIQLFHMFFFMFSLVTSLILFQSTQNTPTVCTVHIYVQVSCMHWVTCCVRICIWKQSVIWSNKTYLQVSLCVCPTTFPTCFPPQPCPISQIISNILLKLLAG